MGNAGACPAIAADALDSRPMQLAGFLELVRSERERAPGQVLAVPVGIRLLSDQLTPVLAYRRLVAQDERSATSFLFESVEGGERQGRYSILGAHPGVEVSASGSSVNIVSRGSKLARGDLAHGTRNVSDPMDVLRAFMHGVRLVRPSQTRRAGSLPSCFVGGWAGYAGYDTVRYAERDKLMLQPPDDRGLADMHWGLYEQVVVFDHADKLVHVIGLAMLDPDDDPQAEYARVMREIERTATRVQEHAKPLPLGVVIDDAPPEPMKSNTTRREHRDMVERAIEYIRAGDIFQCVIGQRFERDSAADPFDVYRALRAVNPSPYMVYLQSPGCILVASSPEILCRVEVEGDLRTVTNRPLAGTRKRGEDETEDAELERDLLSDDKERSEHAMLVDLGRNDVGRVCEPGSIDCGPVMDIERYSHVMHISSTVKGRLRNGLDCWDALRAALPVGTISGAPKIRAMQIIDELEKVKRGPYGGGFGSVGFDGGMDIALALRTMVVPTKMSDPASGTWRYHVQAAGGIVLDSDPDAEFEETVNKASALARAIDVAERAFVSSADGDGG